MSCSQTIVSSDISGAVIIWSELIRSDLSIKASEKASPFVVSLQAPANKAITTQPIGASLSLDLVKCRAEVWKVMGSELHNLRERCWVQASTAYQGAINVWLCQ